MQIIQSRTGWIEIISGPMFSGKSEELIKRIRRAQIARRRVQIFKHGCDIRYDATSIVSHSQQSLGYRSEQLVVGKVSGALGNDLCLRALKTLAKTVCGPEPAPVAPPRGT